MQDRPDKTVLLEALAGFLASDVVPAITDRGLAFRVRIAAHLLGGIAREVSHEHHRDEVDLAIYSALLDRAVPAPADPEALRQAITAARSDLAEHIRSAPLDAEAQAELRAGLRQVLAARIAVGQPRFDLSDTIEEGSP